MLEFADINIKRCAAQMIALERVGEGLLVDDLTPRDVDEHAPRLHRCKAVLVEETGRLRCPLAADHHEIALGQEPIEIPGAGKRAESRWQGPVWVRVAAGADAGKAARASAGRGKSRRARRPPRGVGVSLHQARPRTGIQAARRCARRPVVLWTKPPGLAP